MFDKFLYKTKDDSFVIQFFTKDGLIVDSNLYRYDTGSIIYSYSTIYQNLFQELNIPIAKPLAQKIKQGNKIIEEKILNISLKEHPTTIEQINENLLVEKLVGFEKEEFVSKVERITTSRNETLTRNKTTEPIYSEYLLQGHCFMLEKEKDGSFSLTRTEVHPNSIEVKVGKAKGFGERTFLKNRESIILFFKKSFKEDGHYKVIEKETLQSFMVSISENHVSLEFLDDNDSIIQEKTLQFDLNKF